MDILEKVYITERTDDKGFFSVCAKNIIWPGEIITWLNGKIITYPTATSIQISYSQHFEDNVIKFTNHSCTPNSYINCDDLTLRAVTFIETEEEITINYNATEYKLTYPFICECGSKGCKRIIRGFRFLSENERKSIKHVARHLYAYTG